MCDTGMTSSFMEETKPWKQNSDKNQWFLSLGTKMQEIQSNSLTILIREHWKIRKMAPNSHLI